MPPRRAAPLLALLFAATATFWLGCGGGGSDLAAPELGTLEVVTTTSGPEPDADGYAISIDGAPPAAIAANTSLRQTEVAAGLHTVELSGVAENCAVSGPLQLSVSVSANSVATATYSITCLPTTGTIQVTTTSTGTPADTDGYRLLLDGVDTQPIAIATTITIPGVAPGEHAVGLTGVADGCAVDGENPLTVTVTAGQSAAATMAVICTPPAPETGTLAVVTQTTGDDPDTNGYTYSVDGGDARPIGTSATVNILSLAAGSHTVTLAGAAANCAIGGTNPRSANVPNGGTVQVIFSVTCTAPPSATLDLHIDGLQLTQSVQTAAGDVPLVTNRDGYLRVFVLSNEANTTAPGVRVRLFKNGALTTTLAIPSPGGSTPLHRDEGKLASSWNVKIPRGLFGPGLAVLADVDPDNTIPESNEANNSFPASETPGAQDVRSASIPGITFVPVKQSANGLQGDVSASNKSSFLEMVRQMYPLPGADGQAHAVYTTSSGALQSDDGNGAWLAVLSEIDALRVAEGTSRTYFGVVRIDYPSGIAGLGYIGFPTAIGYDRASDKTRVVAHELGHTWGRLHSPCGGPADADPVYPYADGSIGVYGLELQHEVLRNPATPDIMGYCDNPWISDYTYKGVQEYRAASGATAAVSAPAQRCLLVWGRIVDGRAVLEPAFEVVTRPTLPKKPGPYTIEALTSDGARLFNLSFDAAAVADDPRSARHFAFAVPVGDAGAARIERLQLGGPGGSAAIARVPSPLAGAMTPDIVEARRTSGGAALHWNAKAHPMLMVRDPDTGEVLSFARGGDANITTTKGELEVTISDQVGSHQARVAVGR